MLKKIIVAVIVFLMNIVILLCKEFDNEAKLSFFGSIFGSIIAICGVYYQVQKDISNERELQFSISRPYIVFTTTESIDESMKIFFSGSDIDAGLTFVDNRGLLKAMPKLSLKNLSDNLLMSVKIIIRYEDNTYEEFMVDRINNAQTISFVLGSKCINDFNSKLNELNKLISQVVSPHINNSEKEKEIEEIRKIGKMVLTKNRLLNDVQLKKFIFENADVDNIDKIGDLLNILDTDRVDILIEKSKSIYDNLNNVSIYFTTSVREKVYLEFEGRNTSDKKIFEYNKSKTKLENKGDKFSSESYDAAKIIESPSLSENIE